MVLPMVPRMPDNVSFPASHCTRALSAMGPTLGRVVCSEPLDLRVILRPQTNHEVDRPALQGLGE